MSLRSPERAMVKTQLIASLREALIRGEWRERLPSERILCRLFLVSRSTLRQALAQLAQEGILEIRHGYPTRIIEGNIREVAARVKFKVCIVIIRESEEKAATDQDFYHNLYYRLTKANLPCELLAVSERSFSSGKHDLQNWMENDSRCLWLLMYPGKNVQRWFERFAPSDTLVIGHPAPDVKLPSIDCNHRAIGRHAAGILIGRGHRKIAILGLQNRLPGDLDTEEGFMEVMVKHSDVSLVTLRHYTTKDSVQKQIDALLRRHPDVTALFGYKRMSMMTAMLRLLHHGIRVPQQLSVLSRDYCPAFEHLSFHMASYPMLYTFISREACKQAQARRRDPASRLSTVRLVPEFRDGDSIQVR